MSNVFTKTLAAIVVTLVSFGFAVMPAAAAFSAEQIAALQAAGIDAATITALEGLFGGSTTTSTSTETVSSTQPTGYFHGSTLVMGSRGAAVSALQAALNSCYSAGLVADGSFGPATKAAVMNAQASLGVSVDGVVGPVTGSMLGSCTITTTVAVEGETTVEEEEEDNNTDQFVLSGGDEATIEDFDLDDGEDDNLEEGETGEVAEITFDVEDADVLLERMDVMFKFIGTDNGDDTEPWDVFDTVNLIVNGEEVASIDTDDDDEWDEDDYITSTPANASGTYSSEDDYRLRFRGLSEVLEMGEEATIIIEVEVGNSVDLGSDDTSDWEIVIPSDGIRMVDEAGLTQETPSGDQGGATFSIDEEGAEDELNVSSSTDDPDSTTLEVDDDSKSDEYLVFIHEVEADEDSSDIEVNDVYFSITVTSVSGGLVDDTTKKITDIIDKVYYELDGEREEAELDGTAVAFGADTGTAIAPQVYKVEFNNPVVIDAGDEVDGEVFIKFKGHSGNYDEGTKVMVEMTSANVDAWDAEGSDDLSTSQKNGSATGEVHDLYENGVIVTLDGTSTTLTVVDGGNDYATITMDFEVEAFGEDVYIDEDLITNLTSDAITTGTPMITTSPTVNGTTAYGVSYYVRSSDVAVDGALITHTLTSTAEDDGTYFMVDDGETETFTLKLVVTNVNTDGDNVGTNPQATSVRAVLGGIGWATTPVAATDVYTLNLLSDYKSGYSYIAD